MRRSLIALALALAGAFSFVPAHADSDLASMEWGLAAAHVPQAWQIATTQGAGVRMCSVDTGVDATSPDLAGAVIGGTNTATPSTPDAYQDDNDHGTHTSGIMVGRGHMITGVAPRASLLVAKVLDASGSGSDLSVNAGILWCVEHGAQVVNMSLGGQGSKYDGLADTITWACTAHNTLFSVAAGNDSAGGANDDPASIDSPCLIVSEASNRDGSLADFSNWGMNPRTVTAPGANILSDLPGGHVGMASGTSMATPFTSGVLALLLGMDTPPREAIDIVMATAGRPHRLRPWYQRWSAEYGSGLLNANAAVKYAAILNGIGR